MRCCHSATREGLAAALMLGRYRLEPAACDQPRSLHHSQSTGSGSLYIRCHPQHKRILACRRLSNPCCAVSLEANDCCSSKQEVQLESRVRSQITLIAKVCNVQSFQLARHKEHHGFHGPVTVYIPSAVYCAHSCNLQLSMSGYPACVVAISVDTKLHQSKECYI